MKNLHYRTKFNGKFMKTIYSVFGDCDSILRSPIQNQCNTRNCHINKIGT